jgi:N-acyl-L-homoserine lactone synthetase
MLQLIQGVCGSRFPREMDGMFRNRAEFFGGRLGWDVVVEDGYERDRFDDINPLYLVSVDPIGDVMTYVGLFDPNPDNRLAAFRSELGMGRTVLGPGGEEILLVLAQKLFQNAR